MRRSSDKASLVWVFERGKSEPFAANPVNVGVESHFYSFPNRACVLDTGLEDELLQRIDGQSSEALENLAEGRLSDENRGVIAVFMAFQLLRVPKTRQWMERFGEEALTKMMKMLVRAPGALDAWAKEEKRKTGKEPDWTPEEMRETVEGERVRVRMKPQFFLRQMVEHCEGISRIFHKMRWRVFQSNPGRSVPFFTSDSPVVYWDPEYQGGIGGYGLATRTVRVAFPVDRNTCLVAQHDPRLIRLTAGLKNHELHRTFESFEPKCTWTEASSQLVKMLNRIRLDHSEKYVYSPVGSGTMKEFIAKHFRIETKEASVPKGVVLSEL